MKKYLLYLIKTKWLQTLITAFIPTLIFIITIMMTITRYYNTNNYSHNNIYRAPTVFNTALVFMMIIIPIIVIIRMSIFRNSKDVDLYYSLPISRKNLLITQLLFGFIQLVFIWSFMFLTGLLVFTILSNGYFYTGILLLAYLIVIGYMFILYGITSFLFLRGNTLVDGIAFIVIFNTACLFVSWFFAMSIFRYFGLSDVFVFNSYFSVALIFNHLIQHSLPNQNIVNEVINQGNIGSVINNTFSYTILAVTGYLLNYKFIINEKTENIGRLSISKFGYVSLIPINLFFGMASINSVTRDVSWIAISVLASAGFIGFIIMRRSVRLKWIDIALVVIPIILGIITMNLVQA